MKNFLEEDSKRCRAPSMHVSNSLELGMVSHELTGAAFQEKRIIFPNSVSGAHLKS